ncbi:hypothetical protein Asp14428_37910 [Actinoplanes sp. NBRC 14428]|uniref:Excreted virulence factor EspC (Type VII ESX diderm) n=1 Tax=Pseudosporangium ferrugineum TaxID=439699 RepID=A0A2T0RGM0_9ACTN|nr:hypothetical protein [Pseudosporangium ferrugineum]PRY20305.1 hypothetical protein CLV70_12417 [Pseudosporangium ferrugineum]BCJ52316.1 hypothetical protein Asp14428_37910 [Actinoplanes sp. NBRC 14428]
MTPDLEVDPDGVRAWAAALTAAGQGFHLAPLPPVPGPRWSATDGGTAAAAAARRTVAEIADALVATARAANGTVDDYEAADDRAAARLRNIA